MLSNFGRGDKRDVKVLMKKSVRKLMTVRRLSAMGIGEVVVSPLRNYLLDQSSAGMSWYLLTDCGVIQDAANDGDGLEIEASEADQEILEQMSVWGPAVLHLEEEKMGAILLTFCAFLLSFLLHFAHFRSLVCSRFSLFCTTGMMAEVMMADLGLNGEFNIPNGVFAKFATKVSPRFPRQIDHSRALPPVDLRRTTVARTCFVAGTISDRSLRACGGWSRC